MIDAVLFDFRGTLFNDEDDADVDPELGGEHRPRASGRRRDRRDPRAARRALKKQPEIAAALARCDTSLEVHRDANLAWFRAAGLDDELAVAIWARDGHPDATYRVRRRGAGHGRGAGARQAASRS